MKTKLFLCCVTLFLMLETSTSAQETELSRIPVQTARLISHTRQHNYEKSVFNFEYGVRGDDASANRMRRYDLRYGGISDDGDDKWLDIVHSRGAQSMIKDLGEMSWSEVYYVPVLFVNPTPHTGALTHSYEQGKLKKISPEGVIVAAIIGHMYLMHVKDNDADYYVMFRVEAIDQKGECTLGWKRVPSPEDHERE